MSITKAPRALKRLASTGTGALRDGSTAHSPELDREDLDSSVGHGSMISSSMQHHHNHRAGQEGHSSFDSRWDGTGVSVSRSRGLSKAVNNMFRLGGGGSSSTKVHELPSSKVDSEGAADQRPYLKSADSQEQLAILAQGPGSRSGGGGLIRKASLTLRKRTPSLTNFAFPGNQTASTTALPQYTSAGSDAGHSSTTFHRIHASSSSDGHGTNRNYVIDPRPGDRKHYPPPSASTGAARKQAGGGGIGSIRRKPVPDTNLAIDSSMLLQPSSFSSPSRVRNQQSSEGSGPPVGEGSASNGEHSFDATGSATSVRAAESQGVDPDATVGSAHEVSLPLTAPVLTRNPPSDGATATETEQADSSASKTMSRMRKLSLRRKRGPKASVSDGTSLMPKADSASSSSAMSPTGMLSPGSTSAAGLGSDYTSPTSYLSPVGDPDAQSPISPGPQPSSADVPLTSRSGASSGFPGLSRVTSFRKRAREPSVPTESTAPATSQLSRVTSPQDSIHAQSEMQHSNNPAPGVMWDSMYQPSSAAGNNSNSVSTSAAASSKPPGVKRSGSLGGSFLWGSNKAFGSARRGKANRSGSSTSLSISGPVHNDGAAGGTGTGTGRLGGGATVISGGPAEAFAFLAARSANPGAAYLGGALTPGSGMTPLQQQQQAMASAVAGGSTGGATPSSAGASTGTGTGATPASSNSGPFGVLRRHGKTPSVDAGSSGKAVGSPSGKVAGSPPSSTSRAGNPQGSRPSTANRVQLPFGSPDVILPSEQEHLKSTGLGSMDTFTFGSAKTPTKADLAQRLDEVLQHPEAPTRRLAHNHSRTLTPHSHAAHMSMLGTDGVSDALAGLISGAGGGSAGGGSVGGKGKTLRSSIDIVSGAAGGALDDDAPIVTIRPRPMPAGAVASSPSSKKSSLETGPTASGADTVTEPSLLYGLGFSDGHGNVRDVKTSSASDVHTSARLEPKDVPVSPMTQSNSPSLIGQVSPESNVAVVDGGIAGSHRTRDEPTRQQPRNRTLSLASMLGLGLPSPDSSSSAPGTGVGTTPNLSSIGSAALASPGHSEDLFSRITRRKSSIPDVLTPASNQSFSAMHSRRESENESAPGGLSVGYGHERLPSFSGHSEHHASRPISSVASSHEAANGHHFAHPPSQASRFWAALGPRRGSIGASQTLASAHKSTTGDRSEDDVVSDLRSTSVPTSTARQSVQSVQSQATMSSYQGHNGRGSGLYASSEAPSLETDVDAASVRNARVVMASRVEVRRGAGDVAQMGTGAGTGGSAQSLSKEPAHGGEHLAVEHLTERPTSLDPRQRQFLVEQTEREAAREVAAKVMGGQTLRPLVVNDAENRHSHQAEMGSYPDPREDGPDLQEHLEGPAIPGSQANSDADHVASPAIGGADSTRSSSGSRRRLRKTSYATAEEAIAARKQEQADRKERQRQKEARKHAEWQARYAEKKKTDPLLATRLALFGFQAPEGGDSVGGGDETQLNAARAEAGDEIEQARQEVDFRENQEEINSPAPPPRSDSPLLRASDLVSDADLDVPRDSTGREGVSSMLVVADPSGTDFPHQVRVSFSGAEGLFSEAPPDADDKSLGPLVRQSVLSDWYSAHSHSRQGTLEAPPVPMDGSRLSIASSQFPDYVTTMSHQKSESG